MENFKRVLFLSDEWEAKGIESISEVSRVLVYQVFGEIWKSLNQKWSYGQFTCSIYTRLKLSKYRGPRVSAIFSVVRIRACYVHLQLRCYRGCYQLCKNGGDSHISVAVRENYQIVYCVLYKGEKKAFCLVYIWLANAIASTRTENSRAGLLFALDTQ